MPRLVCSVQGQFGIASGYVYGAPKSMPIDEKQKPEPNNPYALVNIYVNKF